jgi:hypothetical protein
MAKFRTNKGKELWLPPIEIYDRRQDREIHVFSPKQGEIVGVYARSVS